MQKTNKLVASDYVGKKYNRLTVVGLVDKIRKDGYAETQFVCRCECGKEIVTRAAQVKNGHTMSCGCLKYDNRKIVKPENYVGKKYGRLTIVDIVFERGQSYAVCKCDCGKMTKVRPCNLENSHTSSCGCGIAERTSQRLTTHGATGTRLYGIWGGMIARCYDASAIPYKNYGKRGISVCDEWRYSFEVFRDWALSNGYDKRLTIDRINVNGNYEPSNCRWATKEVQSRNQRVRSTSKTGITGVIIYKGAYQATICAHGKHIYLGRFHDIKEAIAAREYAELIYWGNDR